MNVSTNENWPRAAQRFAACWPREMIDRPLLLMTVWQEG